MIRSEVLSLVASLRVAVFPLTPPPPPVSNTGERNVYEKLAQIVFCDKQSQPMPFRYSE